MSQNLENMPQIWPVGALCRAIADALETRFNPVAVRGEISGFTRAASGHCYFTIKDAQGQLRCAMFRRAAQLMDFLPQDGELVELSGRLGVYEPRGELQLVVESMRRAGLGALFEQFLQRKSRLEAEGLFDAARKRSLVPRPRGIGIVTSMAAAALHDVATALQRRVPHVPVVLAPAAVQGIDAAPALVKALQALGQRSDLDVILLVRGGGSIEDLWAFNDEQLARTIVQSPIPVVCGVGHETDFTIADFCADVRAPTPTAAAELCAMPQATLLQHLAQTGQAMQLAARRQMDRRQQQLDQVQARLGRPSEGLAHERLRSQHVQQRLHAALQQRTRDASHRLSLLTQRFERNVVNWPQQARERLARAELRLALLDPHLVLQRGYVMLSGAEAGSIASVNELRAGQIVQATLADGEVDLQVQCVRKN